MFAVCVFQPTIVTAHSHVNLLQGHSLVYAGLQLALDILLCPFPQPNIVVANYVTKEVYATGLNRKHLPIALQCQVKVDAKVLLYIFPKLVQVFLAIGEEHHIVNVAEVIPYPLLLLYPMVEPIQVHVCQILT